MLCGLGLRLCGLGLSLFGLRAKFVSVPEQSCSSNGQNRNQRHEQGYQHGHIGFVDRNWA